jgi:hypothetical protein
MVLIDDSDGIMRGCAIEMGDDKDGQAASFFVSWAATPTSTNSKHALIYYDHSVRKYFLSLWM